MNFELSDNEFKRLQQLVRRTTAIELPETKRQLVYSRFSRRIRALGMDSFTSYCDLIDEGDPAELAQFTSAITTNFSAFFREMYHFDFLADFVRARQDNRRLRIWSAGCATGEEPYSIAITLLETLPDIHRWDIRILATDIDVNAMDVACRGIYAADRVSNLNADLKKRWFRRGKGEFENSVRVVRELKTLIRFRELNLIQRWPMRGPLDIIFCRNVVIYFSPECKQRLFHRFAGLQEPDAPLIVGHSENLANICDRYRPVGNTVYRRC